MSDPMKKSERMEALGGPACGKIIAVPIELLSLGGLVTIPLIVDMRPGFDEIIAEVETHLYQICQVDCDRPYLRLEYGGLYNAACSDGDEDDW